MSPFCQLFNQADQIRLEYNFFPRACATDRAFHQECQHSNELKKWKIFASFADFVFIGNCQHCELFAPVIAVSCARLLYIWSMTHVHTSTD